MRSDVEVETRAVVIAEGLPQAGEVQILLADDAAELVSMELAHYAPDTAR